MGVALGAVIFVVGIFAALAIPRAKEVGPPETEANASCCMCASIVTAGSAMGLMRGVVGFLTFFAAFVLKKQGEPAWVYGLVIVGRRDRQRDSETVIAPLLRQKVREEWILAGSLVAPAIPLLFAARSYGRLSLVFAGFAVAGACGARSPRVRQPLAARRRRCARGAARSPRFERASRSSG